MKKSISIVILLLTFISCQEELMVIGDCPIEPITKSSDNSSNEKGSTISKWEALKIIEPITSEYPDRWVDISDEIIPSETSIEYSPFGIKKQRGDVNTYNSPKYDSWLAVIGPDARCNGGQKQLHVFINCETGEYSKVWLDGRAVVNWDKSRNVYIDDKENNTQLRKKVRPTSRSSSPTRWTVILSGGIDPYNNYDRYYEDCQYIYNALTQHLNYSSYNIFCLMSDGLSTAYDRRTGPYTYDSSPFDLDGDCYIDIDYSATRSWISVVFNYLASVVSEGDQVLLFVTDHGEPGGYIDLWGGETISASELDYERDKLGSNVIIDVVMGQCYSGAFVSALSANNRTIVTAVNSNQVSWANTDFGGYDLFLRYWTDAIYYTNPSISGTHSNGDGYLSLFELYEHGKDNPSANMGCETPQKYASPNILLWGHDLEGNDFRPYIVGDDYASTSEISSYSFYGLPSSISRTWGCSNNLSIITSNSTSASLKGDNLLPSQYVSLGASVGVYFTDLGESWSVSKNIFSVWKPGAYVGYSYIVRNYNNYYLSDYLSVGNYTDTYDYQWYCDSPVWDIIYQDGAYITIQTVPAGSVNVSLVFRDPFDDIIYISDQLQ